MNKADVPYLLYISQDNTIDFLEFVAALNLVFRGDLEHKLRWSFKVYDKDGSGFIDKAELRAIIEVGTFFLLILLCVMLNEFNTN